MRSSKLGSQLDRKSKTWFFTFLYVYVSWIERDKTLISEPSPPKFRYFADQNGRKTDPLKMNFDNFQVRKWISQSELQKQMKKWGHLSSSLFPSWVMVLKFPKIVHLLQICADLSKKSKSIKLKQFIYLKDLVMLFKKIVCFTGVWVTLPEILKNKI